MPSRTMRTAIYFFYGLDAEIRPKSGVPHHPPELFIHLGGAIGIENVLETYTFSEFLYFLSFQKPFCNPTGLRHDPDAHGFFYFEGEPISSHIDTRSSGPRFARPSHLFGSFFDFYSPFLGQEGF